MTAVSVLQLILVGAGSGVVAGLFGIGGGILIVPALVFWLGYSQKMATGTSLAILLPPIGLAAVLEYSRNGNVDWKAAAIIAATMFGGSYVGARIATRLPAAQLKLGFGVFVTLVGLYVVYTSLRTMRGGA